METDLTSEDSDIFIRAGFIINSETKCTRGSD